MPNTGRTHFKKGHKSWCKGLKMNQGTKDKISLAKKGRPSKTKGKKRSQEVITKMKEARKKQVNVKGPKGKPWSTARRKSQKERNLVKRLPVVKNGEEYSSNWHSLRKTVYKRDSWTCQECGSKCHSSTKKKIQCHHIDYDKLNNKMANLITLCASCYAKTNYTREDWIKHFKRRKNNGCINT